MFEGYALRQQRADEERRGWDPDKISASTYCSVEVVVIHRPKGSQVMDWEILEARRRSDRGIADCRGRWQGKWGTQIRPPTDPSARQAVERCLREFFGEKFTGKLQFAGNTGPWVHKATVEQDDHELFLKILDEQAESTPWQGSIYVSEAEDREFDPDGGHKNVHMNEEGGGIRWVSLRNLITERGQDASYLYWLLLFLAIRFLFAPANHNVEPRYWKPGKYSLFLYP